MQNKKYPSLLFRDRIKSIKNEVGEMFEIILESNRKAITLIDDYDEKIAEEVIENGKTIDVLGYELERKCIKFIAVEQPLASDLMFIESTIRIISHGKRIAYLSSNIAESSELIKDINVPQELLNDLQYMADYVQIMLSKGIRCYLNQDLKMAKELRLDDDKVDDLFDVILKQTIDLLAKKTDQALEIVNLIFIARFLERIGDRVVSIGTRTIFLKTNERPDIETIKEDIEY
ncbi:phosphate signaling complex protein PhoU [Methanobrevibacter sp. OttesenSCG-928-K11]|nr:phosphate signaling complex protein PhoU [Methanobrevibacter sp. OttesenSCG-928-K11]MDL2270890.1 phosphate signaling complex protein PhoU [Methanobrevibacter sp. OttesenSCG-928-I08]